MCTAEPHAPDARSARASRPPAQAVARRPRRRRNDADRDRREAEAPGDVDDGVPAQPQGDQERAAQHGHDGEQR